MRAFSIIVSSICVLMFLGCSSAQQGGQPAAEKKTGTVRAEDTCVSGNCLNGTGVMEYKM